MAGKEEFYELYTTYTEHTLWEIETLSSEKQTVLLGCFVVYVDTYILTRGYMTIYVYIYMYGAVHT